MPAFSPPQLDYGRDVTCKPRRRGWRVASLAAMLPGLVVPFVSFACDQSPASQVTDSFIDLPDQSLSTTIDAMLQSAIWLPFFLPIPLVWWMILRLRTRPPKRASRVAFFAIGAGVGLGVTAVFAKAIPDVGNVSEAIVFGGSSILLALSAAIVTRLLARRGLDDDCVTVALVGPYVATVSLFLIVYLQEAQLGWYLSLAPICAAYGELFHIGFAVLRSSRRGRTHPPGIPIPNVD